MRLGIEGDIFNEWNILWSLQKTCLPSEPFGGAMKLEGYPTLDIPSKVTFEVVVAIEDAEVMGVQINSVIYRRDLEGTSAPEVV